MQSAACPKELEKSDVLIHYGVKGQKWGVITKEYEPVAIDHRTSGHNGFTANIRNRINARKEETRQSVQKDKLIRAQKRERYNKAIKIGVAAAGLLAAYGAYRYVKVTKAKAYVGMLDRFMQRNPTASITNEAGNIRMQRAFNVAKENSRTLADARRTNVYLKRTGSTITGRQALQARKTARYMNKMLKYNMESNRFKQAVNVFRKRRVANKILHKVYREV